MKGKFSYMLLTPALLLLVSCGHHQAQNEPDDHTDIIEEISILSNTIPEMFTDYYVTDSTVYYINVSDRDPWQGIPYSKGNLIGNVLNHTENRELNSIEPGSASILPIGTEIYESNEDGAIILASVDNRLIPYLRMTEG